MTYKGSNLAILNGFFFFHQLRCQFLVKVFKDLSFSSFNPFLCLFISAKMATYFSCYTSGQEQKEVIEMEVKLKEKLQKNGLYGMIKDAEAIYQKIAKKLSVKASVVSAASPTPYEISEAHKAHQLEVERKRSQALEETQRRTFRAR